jgi:hypothetical protein
MLGPFHVGKVFTSHKGPWSWILESLVASARLAAHQRNSTVRRHRESLRGVGNVGYMCIA